MIRKKSAREMVPINLGEVIRYCNSIYTRICGWTRTFVVDPDHDHPVAPSPDQTEWW